MYIVNNHDQKGFTLLEVMISIAILAIGMLGIAGLNMVSIEHNNAAYLRSQAVTITQDIVERMRNNPDAVDNGNFDEVKSDEITNAPTVTCLTSVSGCNSAQLADIDIGQWVQTIKTINNDNDRRQLPGASATITAVASTDNLFTIKIEWAVKKLTEVSGSTGTYSRAASKANYEFQVVIH